MVGTSLLTERDPFPIPVYLGEDRVRIIRYMYLQDIKKEFSPYHYKLVKAAIEEKRLYYLYSHRGETKVRYKTINF